MRAGTMNKVRERLLLQLLLAKAYLVICACCIGVNFTYESDGRVLSPKFSPPWT